MRNYLLAATLLVMGGCQAHDSIIHGPSLSAVGEGLAVARHPLPIAYEEPRHSSFQSLWVGGEGDLDLFKDRKAARVGDVITVNISIDDRAQFNNQTGRSRTSSTNLGFGGNIGWNGGGNLKTLSTAGDLAGTVDLGSGSSFGGQGSIGRSEKLRLSIAAVVTEKLPNGNLLISGSQEVMVNKEVRVLNIAGIVRPSDISDANAVAYDKIAEARITYGGRGGIADVQQPPIGQRFWEKVVPF